MNPAFLTYPEVEAFAQSVSLSLVTEHFTDCDGSTVACADLEAIRALMAHRKVYPASMAGFAAMLIDDRIEKAETWSAEPCIDCGAGPDQVEISGVDAPSMFHCCKCEQEWVPGQRNPRYSRHPLSPRESRIEAALELPPRTTFNRWEAQRIALLRAVHQRVDNSGDMGCPQVTVADAVSYWVVRFAHDRGAAEELAEEWDYGICEDYPGTPNPWRDYAPAVLDSASPDAVDVIAILRTIHPPTPTEEN